MEDHRRFQPGGYEQAPETVVRPQVPSTPEEPPAVVEPEGVVARVGQLPIWVPLVGVAVVAALAGGTLGAGIASDGAALGEAEQKLVALEQEKVAAEEAAANLTEEVTRLEKEVAELSRVDLDVKEVELAELEATLQDRDAELQELSARLSEREKAVGSAEQAAAESSFGNGVHLVGADIQPGTYRSEARDFCYWARLSGTGGDLEEVIANGIPDGPAVVTISSSDVAFESTGCGTWTKIE